MADKTRREFLKQSALGSGALHGLSRSAHGAQASTPPRGVVAWWRFGDSAQEELSGNYEHVEGIDGKALKLDGFTTRLTRKAVDAPRLDRSLTIEAWIALAAYPWNWCSLVSHRDGRLAGYDFAIGPEGEIGLSMSMDDVFYRAEWRVCRSQSAVPLRAWCHVAAVYDASGLPLYADGEEAGRLDTEGRLVFADNADLLIGMNRAKKPASHPHRAYSNLPTWIAIDGALDEVKIHDVALSADEIRDSWEARRTVAPPALSERRLPSPRGKPSRFGAAYCKLEYHKEWDDLWPTGDQPDIVVSFDDSPVRAVFWRGTSYSPAWVTENEIWMTDQSVEGWNEKGTFEHMNDPRCLYSHVRVLENHDARVVVHWRYAPVNTRGEFWRFDDSVGWGCWIDEYHTFYPNGTAIRNITWNTGSLATPRQFQETLPLCHPGQRAEDVIELDAVTLGNLRGESATYRWPGDAESRQNQKPNDANIEIVHLKSSAQPFYVFEPGTRIRVLGGTPRRGIYSVFPHVNHWPVAMIPSDGRTCVVPDRASSFSPAIASPPVHEDGRRSRTNWLWGICEGTVESVLAIARSWTNPPAIEGATFERSEHAYQLRSTSARIEASPDSPLVDPAFVVKQWGSSAPRLALDGKDLRAGDDYRFGYRRTLEGDDLIVWLNVELSRPALLHLG
jgi:hypothetical protein